MEILEILKYTIPALLVFLTTFFTVRWHFKTDQEKRKQEIRMLNERMITPIRLQAYERLILFLERINPDSLILRVNEPKMTAGQLQNNILITIRAEFEHNLSQQIYVSNKAWEVVKSAKSNIVKLVNSSADKIKPDEPALMLSKTILESIMDVDKTPSMVAIEFLKKELQLFL